MGNNTISTTGNSKSKADELIDSPADQQADGLVEHQQLVEESAGTKKEVGSTLNTAGSLCSTLSVIPYVGTGFAVAGVALNASGSAMNTIAAAEEGDTLGAVNSGVSGASSTVSGSVGAGKEIKADKAQASKQQTDSTPKQA